MTPIRNNFLAKISDSLKSNQIYNGVPAKSLGFTGWSYEVYPVSRRQCNDDEVFDWQQAMLAGRLMG